jgi:hypothetical protein
MKLIMSTIAALMLLGAVAAQPAEAACAWNGYGWECWHPHWGGWGWHHHWHHWDRWDHRW